MASEEERREVKALVQQGLGIAQDMKALSHLIRSYPGLAWLKRYDESNGRYVMVELSEQYVLQILGGRREDYIGQDDFAVWDYETAKSFFENDEATRTGRRNPTQEVVEPWDSSRTGQKGTFKGRKWAFSVQGTIYVAGMG